MRTYDVCFPTAAGSPAVSGPAVSRPTGMRDPFAVDGVARTEPVPLGTAASVDGLTVDETAGESEQVPLDAAALGDFLLAWQTLIYRVTREAADLADLGRMVRPIEALSQVRATWHWPGEMWLHVGDPTTLPIDPLEGKVDRTMAGIIAGLAANRRTTGITNPIADAVDNLIRALTRLAPEVIIGLPDGSAARLRTSHLSREPWRQSRTEPVRTALVTGRLEMADLHTARFRVRDREGTPYDVTEVPEPDQAARLVGTLVAVRGVLQPGTGTQHHRIEQGRIQPAEPPRAGPARPAPDPLDLTDEQWRQFLADHSSEF
ncbi:MAG: hypothetical protein LCH77_11485 [Actinobacteria bacterium]|nr:hypothetical protein [Actinomycetota bacterium]